MICKPIFDSDTGNEIYTSLAFISGVGIENRLTNHGKISLWSRPSKMLDWGGVTDFFPHTVGNYLLCRRRCFENSEVPEELNFKNTFLGGLELWKVRLNRPDRDPLLEVLPKGGWHLSEYPFFIFLLREKRVPRKVCILECKKRVPRTSGPEGLKGWVTSSTPRHFFKGKK